MPKTTVRLCVQCEVEVGPRCRFCSEACRRKSHERPCEVCGTYYYPKTTGGGPATRTCGRICGAVVRKQGMPPPKAKVKKVRFGCCPTCSQPFVGKGIYCPDHRGYQARTGMRMVQCAGPHAEPLLFAHVVEGSGLPPRFCTDCQTARRREHRRAAKAQRRARRKAAVTESVSPRYVFERDGWRCGICKKAVVKSAVVPHPKAPTLDHIVPLAHGGDHTKANLQCAHFMCNSLKGDRGTAWQEALVG
jgi:5-methylcytosine-specific restriction endonuclease McrA